MYWVLPYGGSLYIEGNESGETGLESFDTSKLSEEHSNVDNKNLKGQGVFSPGLTRCLDEMKTPAGELSRQFKGFHGNQMFGARVEPSPMKLLMQHVSAQGKSGSENPGNGVKSPTQDNKNSLMQTSSNSSFLGTDSQNTSAANRGATLTEGPTGPWFNLLPREPCDKTTITNCWMPTINTQRIPLDGSVPRRPGRPPKQPKTSEGECSSGAVQTPEPVMPSPLVYQLPSLPRPLTLDEVRRSVMESLRQDPALIPKGLFISFCIKKKLYY